MIDNAENFQDIKSIYEFTAKDIYGVNVPLKKYRGHVCIIVNIASGCGYAKNNFEELIDIYQQYEESKGLRILAFPCNQFGDHEPGSNAEIAKYINDRKIRFDVFEKVEVNGNNAHPLWKYLKYRKPGTTGNYIKWNFTKFIIDRMGQPVERHGPSTPPKELVRYLEKYW
ncbi:glutathione peroxidase-like [Coccinella septempunctata]|uniref:glutathione peroxidase-like n=1 Tax=Coccinella septempunctata TaxID=41139 RepID=UPI001D0945E9|nr:glutathione peroxidase-like [Coccinella septempunctata]